MSKTLDQIGSKPEPGDQFVHDGRVFEVVEVDNGWVLYRVERVRLKRPSLMTLGSWRALATNTFTTVVDG